DFPEVDATYRRAGIPALVRPFSPQMDLMLAAATVAVARSGASFLAELAARRLPAVLVPYPAATDDHQRHNAEAVVRAGAALMLQQHTADGPQLAAKLDELLRDSARRTAMATALEKLDAPLAAADIADRIWRRLDERAAGRFPQNSAASAAHSPSVAARAA
ncbi:MAG TPA: UDP-N-acetylglucosamine--N-acetylmuramyl-(pentapeptide) pyrophosphoryl-undecaprenol N-acetylglucosamine transferase, partial [Verrucomicrobiales bacterium]|nr:UDP-N-acetylglucosamine--N-acetylmuramyl-(pentapeptide) pyrophosphoryl-undecaprenol N-acetylglucosamine transferase [Verrucomicrobiales bacterium]